MRTPPSAATRMCSIRCLAGRWLELPCTYNFCSQLLYIEEFLPKKERHRAFLRERSRLYSEAKVLHFARAAQTLASLGDGSGSAPGG